MQGKSNWSSVGNKLLLKLAITATVGSLLSSNPPAARARVR
jgi:hypothetical protein